MAIVAAFYITQIKNKRGEGRRGEETKGRYNISVRSSVERRANRRSEDDGRTTWRRLIAGPKLSETMRRGSTSKLAVSVGEGWRVKWTENSPITDSLLWGLFAATSVHCPLSPSPSGLPRRNERERERYVNIVPQRQMGQALLFSSTLSDIVVYLNEGHGGWIGGSDDVTCVTRALRDTRIASKTWNCHSCCLSYHCHRFCHLKELGEKIFMSSVLFFLSFCLVFDDTPSIWSSS